MIEKVTILKESRGGSKIMAHVENLVSCDNIPVMRGLVKEFKQTKTTRA